MKCQCQCVIATGKRSGLQCKFNAKAGQQYCGHHTACKLNIGGPSPPSPPSPPTAKPKPVPKLKVKPYPVKLSKVIVPKTNAETEKTVKTFIFDVLELYGTKSKFHTEENTNLLDIADDLIVAPVQNLPTGDSWGGKYLAAKDEGKTWGSISLYDLIDDVAAWVPTDHESAEIVYGLLDDKTRKRVAQKIQTVYDNSGYIQGKDKSAGPAYDPEADIPVGTMVPKKKIKAHSKSKATSASAAVPAPTPTSTSTSAPASASKIPPNWSKHKLTTDVSYCDKPTEQVKQPTKPLKLEMQGSVLMNTYKPTGLERDSFKELLSDETFDLHPIPNYPCALNNMKAVMGHLKFLRKELPSLLSWESGFFIRSTEVSLCDYQFIITGPRDTPYENGLWLFSMHLPDNYPVQPPAVKILTTGAGRYRPNPNLYSGGKVCLNLLGTFGAPVWTPTSNLIQILLAIQAQIMVETPLVNEPGYSTSPRNSTENTIYNALQRIITMKIAMIGPMTNPYPGFSDVICKFFFGPKRAELIHQMNNWKAAAAALTRDQCHVFINSSAYNYISGSGDGSGAGIGLLPDSYKSGKLTADELRSGIIKMTNDHANKVLALLYA
jgi:ubiquitin-protein ligase